jgi:hypothetical protein
MALSIDVSRAILRPADQQALVKAVHNANPNDETDYIEWKSGLNLAAADGRVGTARPILGFANRQVEQAARTFEGWAYLLLGIEPGQVIGVERMDPAQIDDALRKYLGNDGPSWIVAQVDFGGSNVMLFSVPPPRWGDRIHTLRSGYNQFRDGDIFVRRLGKTERASAADIAYLEKRAQRRAEMIEVDVQWATPATAALIEPPEDYINDWIDNEREKLLSPMNQPTHGHDAFGTKFPLGNMFTDSRKPEEYSGEVDRYLAVVQPLLFKRMLEVATARGLGRVTPKVINPTHRNLPSVSVEMDIEGVSCTMDPEDEGDDLPEPPRAWGTPSGLAHLAAVSPILTRMPRFRDDLYVDIDNSNARSQIRFPNVDLRPGKSEALSSVSIFVPWSRRGEVLTARWTATSEGVNGIASGSLEISIDSEPIPVWDLLENSGGEAVTSDE